ncbi:MAG: hypothetical protein CMP76_09635 [Flavobacterium sp.]|uniref:hypothetical protein n=1 Tax=Flavobacterium sp. TaxID=239 RepID=UPI000C5748A4|nr:hypothetical protein [Flavobacterium sp.]MBF03544.1 hypothetical protein [Flavobacterium sp.]|tara:strand:+ start:189 stop:704 length:516 start_codon:yes stop_codon:yes gene_type:complete
MSGFSATLIICNKKIAKESTFFSDLNFNKEIVSRSLLNCEFSISKETTFLSKEVYIYDNFYIEYTNELENYGYSEQFWKKIITQIKNPICSVSISSMSRDYGSSYVIIKHIEQLLLEKYHFYLITNNLNVESLNQFVHSKDIVKVKQQYYIISEKTIHYLIQNESLDFLES